MLSLVALAACSSHGATGGDGFVSGDAGTREGTLGFGAAQRTLGTGSVVAVFDANSDGKVDVVVAGVDPNTGGPTGGSLLAQGDGSFKVGGTFSTLGSSAWLASGDYTGDGHADLFSANGSGNPGPSGGNMAALPSQVNGMFGPAKSFAAEADPVAVESGDFNHDGKADAAIAAYQGPDGKGRVDVFLAGVANATSYGGGSLPQAIAIGDFNGDGELDLAAGGGTSVTGSLVILLGSATGAFTPGASYQPGKQVAALAAADADGDGKLDLVIADQIDATVAVAHGNGDGTFALGRAYPTGSGHDNTMCMVVGDFNGGGRLDAAVLNIPGAGPAYLSVVLGGGDGTFGAPAMFGQFNTTGVIRGGLGTGDFNGDGRPDLVVAHGLIDVFLNSSQP